MVREALSPPGNIRGSARNFDASRTRDRLPTAAAAMSHSPREWLIRQC
jgi:hypothetical protein